MNICKDCILGIETVGGHFYCHAFYKQDARKNKCNRRVVKK